MLARAVVAGCAALLLAACAAEAEQVMPPITPEPELPLFQDGGGASPDGTAAPSGGTKARKVLQRVLRGAGAGRKKVCANVAPAYARDVLGGPCASWVKGLSAEDRERLRAVKVGRPEAGEGANVWVFKGSEFVWPLGAAAAPGVERYVMRLKGKRWVLAG
ncbi:hypothetical protein [Actinocorallia sp. A-T 12471]|uniref:hypothetical protein n=1 Tax=Actinocorallia sp. A-T 12471 TaxID=3089813 RepID=UPI0029D0F673|nr:hypothetical protein [Actinocorallia sp. A-T 12471]MDX6744552.1 hypothetical protein [Actinocorallia sp. A-T 12471]